MQHVCRTYVINHFMYPEWPYKDRIRLRHTCTPAVSPVQLYDVKIGIYLHNRIYWLADYEHLQDYGERTLESFNQQYFRCAYNLFSFVCRLVVSTVYFSMLLFLLQCIFRRWSSFTICLSNLQVMLCLSVESCLKPK